MLEANFNSGRSFGSIVARLLIATGLSERMTDPGALARHAIDLTEMALRAHVAAGACADELDEWERGVVAELASRVGSFLATDVPDRLQ